MALNAPTPMLATTIGLFSAAAPTWSRRMNLLCAGGVVIAQSPGAATLYGVYHPGAVNQNRVFKFTGDGATTVFTLAAAAIGVVYPTTVAASLTVINALEAIALTYTPMYAANAVVRQRVGSDASPTGTQWKINGVTVTFGTAPVLGQIVEIIVPDATTIAQLAGSPFTANIPVISQTRDFMVAGVAAVILTPAGAR